ncbi:MAG: hypothetical protein IIX64_00550 [Bacteroidales bacterium]|nr:hypothetical protein [Bacteroidales bacterium]
MSLSTLMRDFFLFLNERVDYVVLRNSAGLPEQCHSRDVDIAIRRKDYRAIKKDLLSLLEKNNWKLITYLRSDRLITWVVASLDGVMQWDFFFDTSVFGIRLLDVEQLLAGARVQEGSVPVKISSASVEFLDKYLYDRAVGAAYPAKYAQIRAAVEQDSQVLSVVEKMMGVKGLEACDKSSSRKMLLHAFFRAPLRNFARFLRFEYWRIRNYLCSDCGFTVGFTGPDGSGKTTVIDLVIEGLGKVFEKAHTLNHFRPTLFGNISDVAHSAGLKKEVDDNYSDPHRGGKTGVLSSLARLCYYSVDYILGYWLAVKSKTRITWLVFFDRYFTDIICDSRRTRIYLPIKFLYAWSRILIPSLDYNVLLTVDADTILARKKELTRDEIEAINAKIDFLMARRGVQQVSRKGQYVKVLNDRTPKEAANDILQLIFDAQHRKNSRRI